MLYNWELLPNSPAYNKSYQEKFNLKISNVNTLTSEFINSNIELGETPAPDYVPTRPTGDLRVGVEYDTGNDGSVSVGTLLSPEMHLKNSAVGFVDAMNKLVDGWADAMSVSAVIPTAELILGEDRHGLSAWFWGGTLYKTDDQVIDYSQSASNRAGDLLFLIVAMITYDTQKDPDATSDFDEFWDELIHEKDPVSYIKRARRAINRQIKEDGPKGFASRILQQQEVDWDREKARLFRKTS